MVGRWRLACISQILTPQLKFLKFSKGKYYNIRVWVNQILKNLNGHTHILSLILFLFKNFKVNCDTHNISNSKILVEKGRIY